MAKSGARADSGAGQHCRTCLPAPLEPADRVFYEHDWHTAGVQPFIAAATTCAGTFHRGLCKAMGWKARESDQPNRTSNQQAVEPTFVAPPPMPARTVAGLMIQHDREVCRIEPQLFSKGDDLGSRVHPVAYARFDEDDGAIVLVGTAHIQHPTEA